jgi:lysophospholipase L1-like esterase
LSGLPTIPTDDSQLANSAGYITTNGTAAWAMSATIAQTALNGTGGQFGDAAFYNMSAFPTKAQGILATTALQTGTSTVSGITVTISGTTFTISGTGTALLGSSNTWTAPQTFTGGTSTGGLYVNPTFSGTVTGAATAAQGALASSALQPTGGAFDSSTLDFISRSGITDLKEEVAIDAFVKSLKAASLWSKFYAIYPYVGSSATSCAQNLVGSTFTITWNGSVNFNKLGMHGDGISGYGDTGFIPATHSTAGTDFAMGVDVLSQEQLMVLGVGSGNGDMGVNGGGGMSIIARDSSNIYTLSIPAWGGNSNGYTGSAKGLWVTNRLGTSVGSFRDALTLAWYDGIAVNATLPAFSIYVGAVNNSVNNSNIWMPCERTQSLAFIAQGLTLAQAESLITIIERFRTSMGRDTEVFVPKMSCVFTGDSLTVGSPLYGASAWPRQLLNQSANGWNTASIRNVIYYATGGVSSAYAISGWASIQQLLYYGDTTNVATSWYPTDARLLSVWFGTNDIQQGLDHTVAYANLKTIWANGRAAGARVAAATIMKRGDFTTAQEAQRVSLNADIRSHPELYDYLWEPDLILTDFTNLTYFQSDQIHCTALGYKLLAAAFASRVPMPTALAAVNPINAPTLVTSGSYTITPTDSLIAITGTAGAAITLPTNLPIGQRVTIKDQGGMAGTTPITTVGTVDGVANPSISTNYGGLRVYTNGTRWFGQ